MLASAAAAFALVACGGGSAPQPAAGQAPKLTGTLTVLAAASLTEAFTKIGDQLHAKNPDLDVKFSFAGSPTLVTQVQQGAPADILATADQTNMAKVTGASLNSGAPSVFAHNKLTIAVESGNPKKINGVSDLANPAIKVAVCAPGVPCGTYSTSTFSKAGVTVKPVTQEQDVKSVLTKVGLGEVDAGIVYVTDVKSAAGKVDGVTIPDAQNTIAEYPITELKSEQNATAAKAFLDYVLGKDGQKVLADYGFLPAQS